MRSNRRSLGRLCAMLALAAMAQSCSGDDGTGPEAPRPGTLTVRLSSAGESGAAFLLTVTGDSIGNVRAAAESHELYWAADGQSVRAAVIGSIAKGDLVRLDVPDVGRASAYDVRLDQVAGPDNALRSTSAYSLTVVEPAE